MRSVHGTPQHVFPCILYEKNLQQCFHFLFSGDASTRITNNPDWNFLYLVVREVHGSLNIADQIEPAPEISRNQIVS